MSVTSLDPAISVRERVLRPTQAIEAIRQLNAAACPPCSRWRRSFRKSRIMRWKPSLQQCGGGGQGRLLPPHPPPHEVAPLFRAWLDDHIPTARQGDATIQAMRGGKDNDRTLHPSPGVGHGRASPTRFAIAARKAGLGTDGMKLRRDFSSRQREADAFALTFRHCEAEPKQSMGPP
jgi:hypothetical protein